MKHIWSILCKNAIVDRESNNISLVNILEEITIAISPEKKTMLQDNKPIKIPMEVKLVSLWAMEKERGARETDIQIEEHDPQDKNIFSFEKKVRIPKNKKRVRMIIGMSGLKFTKSGNYTIHIKKDSQLLNKIPLEIKIKPKTVS